MRLLSVHIEIQVTMINPALPISTTMAILLNTRTHATMVVEAVVAVEEVEAVMMQEEEVTELVEVADVEVEDLVNATMDIAIMKHTMSTMKEMKKIWIFLSTMIVILIMKSTIIQTYAIILEEHRDSTYTKKTPSLSKAHLPST